MDGAGAPQPWEALRTQVMGEFVGSDVEMRLYKLVRSIVASEVRGHPGLKDASGPQAEAFLQKRVAREISLLSVPGSPSRLPAFVDNWLRDHVDKTRPQLSAAARPTNSAASKKVLQTLRPSIGTSGNSDSGADSTNRRHSMTASSITSNGFRSRPRHSFGPGSKRPIPASASAPAPKVAKKISSDTEDSSWIGNW